MLQPTEFTTIKRIAERAAQMYERFGTKVAPVYIAAELSLCHERVCPLKLDELLTADDSNFAHDIGGIHRHLDIVAEKMRDCFLPRFAAS